MESMTGYAFIEKSTEQFSFSVELKSLNSKYLETYVNVPRILKNEENELAALIKNNISRGKVELNLEIFDWQDAKPVSLNAELIEKYYKELQNVHSSLKIEEPLKFESILSLEGLTNRERSVISEKSRKAIYDSAAKAIKMAIDMRKKEGTVTKKDISSCIAHITETADLIKSLAKDNAKEKQQLLKNRIESLAGCPVDDTRIYAEIAVMADKLDINEEIVRLSDHLKKFKQVMKESGQVGKKLDFLSQEMFREINTIASKSNSSEISHHVVDVKNNIDKIREQCRNIV
jgi:uncharacterized protein (TIGR00255 family)